MRGIMVIISHYVHASSLSCSSQIIRRRQCVKQEKKANKGWYITGAKRGESRPGSLLRLRTFDSSLIRIARFIRDDCESVHHLSSLVGGIKEEASPHWAVVEIKAGDQL
jgi:hypothetical protein